MIFSAHLLIAGVFVPVQLRRLVVVGIEVGGRFGGEAVQLLRLLARHRTRWPGARPARAPCRRPVGLCLGLVLRLRGLMRPPPRKSAPRTFELRVRSMSLAPGGGRHGGTQLDVYTDVRAGGARRAEVHVGGLHMVGDPSAGFATDSRDGMLKGQRARCEDPGGNAGRAVVAKRVKLHRGSGGEVAACAANELGTARWVWRSHRELEEHSRHGRQRARPPTAAALEMQV